MPQKVPQEPEAPAQESKAIEWEASRAYHRPVRLSWAKPLLRIFSLDVEHCPNCGGKLEIIAAILKRPVIHKMLTHLGLQVRAAPRSAARGQALQSARPLLIHHCSGGSARGAAGVGCARVDAGPMEAAGRRGATCKRRPEGRLSAGLTTPYRFAPASKDRFRRIGAMYSRAVSAMETENRRLKNYPQRMCQARLLACGCPRMTKQTSLQSNIAHLEYWRAIKYARNVSRRQQRCGFRDARDRPLPVAARRLLHVAQNGHADWQRGVAVDRSDW